MNERRAALLAQPFGPEHPAFRAGGGPLNGIINLLTRVELWRQRPLDSTILDARTAELNGRLKAVRQNSAEETEIGRLRLAALGHPELEPAVWAAENLYHDRRTKELGERVLAYETRDGSRFGLWFLRHRRDSHQKRSRDAAGKLLRRP